MDNVLKKSTATNGSSSLFDLTVGFQYYQTKNGDSFVERKTDTNYLFFVLDGDVAVTFNEYYKVPVKSREFFLIPKKSELTIKVIVASEIIAFTFESFKTICDNVSLKSYSTIAEQMEYEFKPLPIRYALNDYLYLLLRYLRNGLDCTHLIDLKQQELFILLKQFYDKKEMGGLFHPLLGKSPDFKDQVFQHYQEVNGVDELARKLGMARTSFDMKFKSEFGIPPLQWMLKQKARHIRYSMSETGSTLSDIMRKYNFNSPTHLNRFCKQQFGCSPSELMKEMRQKE